LGPGNPEGTGARIGADGDLQLRLPVEGVILRDDAYFGAAPPETFPGGEKPGLLCVRYITYASTLGWGISGVNRDRGYFWTVFGHNYPRS